MKKILTLLGLLVLITLIVIAFRFFSGGSEDDWICEKGQWLKHGNPSTAKPKTGCRP